MSAVSTFQGARLAKPTQIRAVCNRRAVVTRADFGGSAPHVIICVSTALCLAAGRFGKAPTANNLATAGLKLVENDSGMKTGDPMGFTAVDVLALGSMGHILGIGIVLGLKGTGAL